MKMYPNYVRLVLLSIIVVGTAVMTVQNSSVYTGQVSGNNCSYGINAGDSCDPGDYMMCVNETDCFCYRQEGTTCSCGTEVGYCGAGACLACGPRGTCCLNGSPRLTNEFACSFMNGTWTQGSTLGTCAPTTASSSSQATSTAVVASSTASTQSTNSQIGSCRPGPPQPGGACDDEVVGGCACGSCQFVQEFSGYFKLCQTQESCQVYAGCTPGVGRCGMSDDGYPLQECSPGEAVVISCSAGYTYEEVCPESGCIDDHACNGGGSCTSDSECGEIECQDCNEGQKICDVPICTTEGTCAGKVELRSCDEGMQCETVNDCNTEVTCSECSNGEKECWVPVCDNGDCTKVQDTQQCNNGDECTGSSDCGTEQCGACVNGEMQCQIPYCDNNTCYTESETRSCVACSENSDCGQQECLECVNGQQTCLLPVCTDALCTETSFTQDCNVGNECTEHADCGEEQCTDCIDGEEQCAVPRCTSGVCGEIYINRFCNNDDGGDDGGDPPQNSSASSSTSSTGGTSVSSSSSSSANNSNSISSLSSGGNNQGICCIDKQCVLGTCSAPYETTTQCEAICNPLPPIGSTSSVSSNQSSSSSGNAAGYCCTSGTCGACQNGTFSTMQACNEGCFTVPRQPYQPDPIECDEDNYIAPRMRIQLTKVLTTDEELSPVEPVIYVDGPHAGADYRGDDQHDYITKESGEWFNLRDIHDNISVLVPGIEIYKAQEYDPYVYITIAPAFPPYNPKNPDDYIAFYGNIELSGATLVSAKCRPDNYIWYCPEHESDGIISEPENDEVWIEDDKVHFALHAQDVMNEDGRSDVFLLTYDQCPWSPSSASSENSNPNGNSSSSSSKTSTNTTSSFSSFSFGLIGGDIGGGDDDDGGPLCGNGVIDDGEQCDDANDVNTDGCNNACRVNITPGDPECGNGFKEYGEECDDGNNRENDGCSPTCKKTSIPPAPGTSGGTGGGTTGGSNGTPSTGGGGNGNGIYIPSCGNSYTDLTEECDDGNTRSGDGCSADCRLEIALLTPPECGNGIVEANEECDDGNTSNDDTCSNVCTNKSLSAHCGNGTVDPLEQCDDGNYKRGDGCSPFCSIEKTTTTTVAGESTETLVAAGALCGNGILEFGEECDDSNNRSADGCSDTCQAEIGICGDGIVQKLLGEQCEQATHSKDLPYTCIDCQFVTTTCGDGTVDAGEECDEGAENSNQPDANCRTTCRFGSCGDAIVDSDEECDDGNKVHGDGCTADCRVETQPSAPQLLTEEPLNIVLSEYTANAVSPSGNLGTQEYGFPEYPNMQQLPYQLPLAQLQPLIQSKSPAGDTGPAAVAVIGAGAAAGVSWIRRKKRNT